MSEFLEFRQINHLTLFTHSSPSLALGILFTLTCLAILPNFVSANDWLDEMTLPVSTTSEIHSARASMAGFLYQLRRGLIRLAESTEGSRIGLETLDDVVLEHSDGTSVVEQNKLSFRRNPIPDSSANLWNTLATWIGLINDGEVNLDLAEFCLVSTFDVGRGIAAQLKQPSASRNNREITREILALANAPKDTYAEYATIVRSFPKKDLVKLVSKITVIDSSCQDAKEGLAQRLHLTPEIGDDVLNGLMGWLYAEVITHFEHLAKAPEERGANWIKTADFNRELSKLIARHHNKQLIIRTSLEIVADEEKIAAEQGARFVRQLQILEFGSEEDTLVFEAIIDYLKADAETTRLATQNEVTKQKFEDFETQLSDHWKRCRRNRLRQPLATPELTGQQILDDSVAIKPFLDGQPVTHEYLSRGVFHAMANRNKDLKVGWHPDFEKKLKDIG